MSTGSPSDRGRNMEVWRLIDLGMAEPFLAQTFYEAVALAVDTGLSPNTIILVQPSSPYVCVGFHQEVEKEVDVEYCRDRGFPIVRRFQGGGAVYLDSNQIFYQIVARRESEIIPPGIEELFEKFLKVTIYAYRKLGLPAEFKTVNDVIVNGRKISGNGAGSFGDNTVILVGNIILDLDYDSMANVLRVSDEKFQDKMFRSMVEWLTSLRKELGFVPPAEEIKSLLVEGYEQILGIRLVKSTPTEDERRIWEEEVAPRHSSEDWLQMEGLTREGPVEGRAVKIVGGIKVVEVDHKAKKLIRVRAELGEDRILDIVISGDFFVVPKEALRDLESSLRGATLDRDEVLNKVHRFYEKSQAETPGLSEEDFTEAIMKLRSLAEVQ